MLVLGRDVSEKVTITIPPNNESTEIQIQVISLRNKTVRLGFVAAPNCLILRNELIVEDSPNET